MFADLSVRISSSHGTFYTDEIWPEKCLACLAGFILGGLGIVE